MAIAWYENSTVSFHRQFLVLSALGNTWVKTKIKFRVLNHDYSISILLGSTKVGLRKFLNSFLKLALIYNTVFFRTPCFYTIKNYIGATWQVKVIIYDS